MQQESQDRVNRRYKDTVFRMLFSEPEHLLSLYNALSRRHYTDVSQFQFRTLDDAIYMNVKNDISFIFHSQLFLWEHQSTVNPNIPLRDLHYVSSLLGGMVPTEHLYGRSRVKIPAPSFVVFYNGTEEGRDRGERIDRVQPGGGHAGDAQGFR